MANVLGTLFGDIADAIRAKSGESGTMKPAEFPAKIAAIPAGGGGSAAGAVTVTFCNYDGTELHSRQVFIGDDCPDPVTQGKISTPTKASTAQYDYTHNGWSTAAYGTKDENALKNITADKTVYSAFKETVRTYTVRFYDGDTVMKTETVAYGSKATPPDVEKEGFSFNGWTPSDLTIKADTDFYGAWEVDAGWIVWKEFPKETITTTGNLNNLLVYSPDGSKLYVASDNLLYIYDATVQPYNLINTYSLYANADRKATYIAISNDGSLLAVSLSNKSGNIADNLLIYSVNANGLTKLTLSATNAGTSLNIGGLAFHPDGNSLFVVWGLFNEFCVINTSNTSITLPATRVAYSNSTSHRESRAAVYTHDGEKLIVGASSYNTRAVVLDVLNGYQVEDRATTFGSSTYPAKVVDVSPDDKYVAFAGGGNISYDSFAVFDMTTSPYTVTTRVNFGKYTQNYISSHIEGTCIAFSHDGSLLAIGVKCPPFIKIYDTATWTEMDSPMQLPSAYPYSLSFNHNDTCLAMSVSGTDKVNLYELRK
jgi:WD40 repeat protein